MRPAPFRYLAPRSPEEAVAKLAEHAGDARLLAGGQSLIPLLNLRMARPSVLIDLGRCPELAYLRREDGWIAIGPMTRQADAEHSALVREHCPLMAKVLPYLGPPTIRNRGTIGGTLAHADRLAELPVVAVLLGAQMIAQGPKGRRSIAARDFFVSDLTNALAPDEMLREVRFPVATHASGCGFVEASIRHHDLMLLGVAARLEFDGGGRCVAAQLAVGGGYSVPQVVSGRSPEEATRACAEEVELQDDTHASAGYRRRILPGLVECALRQALGTRKTNAD